MICRKRSAQAAGRSRVEECRAPGPSRAESQDVGKNEQLEKWPRFQAPPYIFAVNQVLMTPRAAGLTAWGSRSSITMSRPPKDCREVPGAGGQMAGSPDSPAIQGH